MDPGPAGVDGAGPRTPGARGPRPLLVAGAAAMVVLLAVIAVLAIRLAGTPPAAKAATPRPAPTPTSLTVPVIYQRLPPPPRAAPGGSGEGAGGLCLRGEAGTSLLLSPTAPRRARFSPPPTRSGTSLPSPRRSCPRSSCPPPSAAAPG